MQYSIALAMELSEKINGVQRLGPKIRALRKRRGITLKELALTLGFPSHSYVSEIERGKKTPNSGPACA
jgi:transcriptional regulator with XRE-family HTH domain